MSTESTPLMADSPTVYTSNYDGNFSSSPKEFYFKDLAGKGKGRLVSEASQDTLYEENWNEEKRIWITAHNPEKGHQRRHRTLVLCFDGTGDQFDGDNSNVVQLLAMLRKDDISQQLVYYQPGIGTYTDPLIKTPISSYVSTTLDSMLAWNLSSHVKDGYTFLMQHYTTGDKICIFGFSRGAYTARALAGMLQKVGLLPPSNHQQLPFAYDMYKREDPEGLKLSYMFKKTFSRHVNVEFLGVWDTVASVGLIPRYLPFIHENTGIRFLRHALALDERRVKFLPQFCVNTVFAEQKSAKKQLQQDPRKNVKREDTLTKVYEDFVNKQSGEKPDCLEVWFAGVHTDVGGGSVPNDTRNSLARIPLRWMIRECFRCNTGIIFDAAQLQQIGLRVYMEGDQPALGDLPPRIRADISTDVRKPQNPTSLSTLLLAALISTWQAVWTPFLVLKDVFWPKKKQPGKLPLSDLDEPERLVNQEFDHEAREELEDALSPFYDQLDARAAWHLLEWIPQRVKKQKAIIQKAEEGNSYKWLWNRGMGRKIPKSEMEEGLKIHRSVKTRLEAAHRLDKPYVPRVRPTVKFDDGTESKEKCLTHGQWNVDNPKYWEWVD